jgi:hypothetical protein
MRAVNRHLAVPTPKLRLLPPVPRTEVIRIRDRKRKVTPLEPSVAGEFGCLETLKSQADWRQFSRTIFGDDRLAPETERAGNVIALPVRKQRSSSAEIQAVRLQEERRGRQR